MQWALLPVQMSEENERGGGLGRAAGGAGRGREWVVRPLRAEPPHREAVRPLRPQS